MTLFFTADTHFGHNRILEIGNGRPFSTLDEQDHALISNWNAVVGKSDRVFHLGDLSFYKPGRTIEILRQLNGQIHLIKGNHDPSDSLKKFLDANLLATVELIREERVEGQHIVMCHYPMLTWNKAHYGSWMLHGHSHGNLEARETTRIDVGADCWNYTPASYDQIAEVMKRRKYKPVDHHD